VLSRNGEVHHRHRVEALPIRIARGYHNDFILDDRHISANHAVVECNEAGALEVHDMDSRNGVVHRGKRLSHLLIDGDTIFRLGHTSLRIRAADYSVADAMRDTTLHGWEGWPPALTGLAMLVLVTLGSVWLSETEKAEAIGYVSAIAGILGMALVWCGGWALANRLFAGQTRFGRHIFIAASAVVAGELLDVLLSVVAYAFSLESLTRYGSHLGVAIVATMVYFHLLTISANHPRRILLFSALLAVFGSGGMLMLNYQSRDQFADELYMSNRYPPSLRMSSDMPVDRFLSEAAGLKEKVDAARAEKVGAEGDESE
jgi:hypothetical protein